MADESDEKAALELHISNVEAKHAALLQEKEKMEEDFGLQRAKLKDLFLQKEEELRMKTDENSALAVEVDQLQQQVHQLQGELDEARSQVTIAECTAENDVAVERRKCEEEIASVQQIMREEINSAEDEISNLQSLVKKYEGEKLYYRDLYEKAIEDCDLKRDSLLSPGVLSAVTKSLAKRVPSLSPAHSAVGTPEKFSGQGPVSAGTAVGATTSPPGTATTPNSGEQSENLEESMKKAQEDAALLRSLVVPLEEEIAALKHKIREQDAQLRTRESQEQMAIKTSDILAPLFQGKSAEELVQELDEKLQGVKNTLEVEKASRADLELYTAILNTQKTALTDHVERLRGQMADVRQLFEEERKEHKELKNTWQRANDQFLEAQRMHLADIRRMRSLLTAEQLRKFHELQRLDSRDDDSPTVKIQSWKPTTEEMLEQSCNQKPHDLSELGEEPLGSRAEDDASTVLESEKTAERIVTNVESSSDVNSSTTSETLVSKYSPEKMPQLTDDQKRALSGFSIDTERFAGKSHASILNALGLPSHQRIVSEEEWKKLQAEIKKSQLRLSDSCPVCVNLENRIKKFEVEIKDYEKQNGLLEKAIVRQKDDLERESLYRKQTEEQWKQKAQEYDKKEKALQADVDRVTALHSQVVSWSKKIVQTMDEKLRSLTEKREAAQLELLRLQKENDNLIGKHSQHSQEMQNEIINLPDSMEEMQLLLLRYREDVIAAKVAKEHIEETSSSKILFLKDQILQEQHEKTTMEDRLSADIDHLRKRVSALEQVEHRLERESRLRIEAETRLREVEQKFQDTNKRSQQLINGLKHEVDEQTKIRTRLEREIMDLKSRVASLQHDLETSEAVQRDFVRLSQSLQVQLEKIRQSENEVRWQHEEDIEECSNCKQRFTTVGRRKHHCKHCGKIFCSECVTKTVPSGPSGRSSRVCDVCHTLLVQDATPFFSTEPPQSPD